MIYIMIKVTSLYLHTESNKKQYIFEQKVMCLLSTINKVYMNSCNINTT